MLNCLRLIAACATMILFYSAPPSIANATEYPNKMITLISPYPPGGVVDPVARAIAAGLEKEMGQTVIVENHGGAGGAIGAQLVADGAKDGYTLLIHSGAITIHPVLAQNPLFDTRRDFIPVALVASAPYLIIGSPQAPFDTFSGLLEFAKKNPGRVTYGSSGVGSSTHLATEYMSQKAGIDLIHVPFAGGGPTQLALMSGTIDFSLDTVAGSRALIDSGRLRALAVTTSRRSDAMAQVPTVSESGLPGYDTEFWLGIFVRTGTPTDVVERLRTAISKIVAAPKFREMYHQLGLDVPSRTPDEFKELIDQELTRWADIIKAANIERQ